MGTTKSRKKRKGKSWSAKILKVLLILLIIGLILGVVAAGVAFTIVRDYLAEIPEFEYDTLFEPPLTSYLYDKNGKRFARLFSEQNRVVVPLEVMPDHLINAFVAIEDERFFQHHGVDIEAFGRALLVNIRERRIVEGFSTITQQLVKNTMLTPERTFKRKIQEMYLAVRLEQKFSKEEILELYLNWIYFDHSTHGVEAASRMFFGKSVKDITLAEAALLAGVPNNPSLFSPYRNMELSKRRQSIILNRMASLGMITAEEARAAKEKEIKIIPPLLRATDYPHFFEYVVHHELQDILESLPQFQGLPWQRVMYQGGLKIHTTLDPELQAFAEEVFKNPDNYPKTITDDLGMLQPQANMVLAEPETGFIRVLIGGREFGAHDQLLRFTRERQPGSAIKPLTVYAPALEEGLISPGTVIDDAPVIYTIYGKEFLPENFDSRFLGLVTVREALARSINIPAVKILMDMLGIDKAIAYAEKLGITTFSEHDKGPSPVALGGLTHGVTTIDMVQAYSAFANQGIKVGLSTITKIENSKGVVLYEHKPASEQVLEPETAYFINNMLIDTVRWGTATRLDLDRDLAAKTGTTDNLATGYLVAYTRDYVLGLWMGYDIPGDHPGGHRWWNYRHRLANPILKKAHKDLPKRSFVRPASIVTARVSKKSNLRPGPYTPPEDIQTEIFIRGTVPNEECNLHIPVRVCTESGLLPTEFCPQWLLEERIFLNRPAYIETDARWARHRRFGVRRPEDAALMPPVETCDSHISRPASPRNLSSSTAEAEDGAFAILSWDHPPEEIIAGFLIYRQYAGEETPLPLTETPITASFFVDTTVENNKTYIYHVFAVDALGIRSEKASVEVTILEKPEEEIIPEEQPEENLEEPQPGEQSDKPPEEQQP